MSKKAQADELRQYIESQESWLKDAQEALPPEEFEAEAGEARAAIDAAREELAQLEGAAEPAAAAEHEPKPKRKRAAKKPAAATKRAAKRKPRKTTAKDAEKPAHNHTLANHPRLGRVAIVAQTEAAPVFLLLGDRKIGIDQTLPEDVTARDILGIALKHPPMMPATTAYLRELARL